MTKNKNSELATNSLNFRKSIYLILSLVFFPILFYVLYLLLKDKINFTKKLENSTNENPEIVKTLEEYFSSLEKYLKSSFLRKYILSLRSISLEDIEKLEKLYPEVDVKTISFPFQSVELVKNMKQINIYILKQINQYDGDINNSMKNEHSYILKELKRLIALKAHKEILEELKNYIKDKDESKWNDLFNSEPISLII